LIICIIRTGKWKRCCNCYSMFKRFDCSKICNCCTSMEWWFYWI